MSEKYPNKWLHRLLVRLAAALCLAAATPAASAAAGLLDSFGGIRETTSYRATYADTLLDVARRFDLGYVEIVAANPGTDPWIPGEGTNVVLPTVHLPPDAEPEGIVVNLADMRLYYFPGSGQPMQSFPIGIGRDGLTTPLGSTSGSLSPSRAQRQWCGVSTWMTCGSGRSKPRCIEGSPDRLAEATVTPW